MVDVDGTGRFYYYAARERVLNFEQYQRMRWATAAAAQERLLHYSDGQAGEGPWHTYRVLPVLINGQPTIESATLDTISVRHDVATVDGEGEGWR